MGWLSNLFKQISGNPAGTSHADMLNGYSPIFSQFGTDIYASDVVQQAVGCIVSEIKKLRPEHVREQGNDVIPVNSSVQAVLNSPNQIMTTSEFLEKVCWMLYLNYNAFIIPIYYTWRDEKGNERRKYEALYPIQPTQVDFIEDGSGQLFVKFHFGNGQEYTLRYADIIHVRKNYSVNQYMGGNEAGQPDNEALVKTLRLNHRLLDGVSSAVESSFAVNGIVKINTMLDGDKMDKALKELEDKLKRRVSGFLPMDLKHEYIPIKREIQMVDGDTLKFIDEKILRHFGVSLPILTGDYTKEQYEAFYQKTLEPLIINLAQSFTKAMFTSGELSHHNKVMFYAKDLIFMSIDQKIAMLKELAPTGSLYENEKRAMFGLRPLAELEGKRYISLNWIDSNKANEYQTGTE